MINPRAKRSAVHLVVLFATLIVALGVGLATGSSDAFVAIFALGLLLHLGVRVAMSAGRVVGTEQDDPRLRDLSLLRPWNDDPRYDDSGRLGLSASDNLPTPREPPMSTASLPVRGTFVDDSTGDLARPPLHTLVLVFVLTSTIMGCGSYALGSERSVLLSTVLGIICGVIVVGVAQRGTRQR